MPGAKRSVGSGPVKPRPARNGSRVVAPPELGVCAVRMGFAALYPSGAFRWLLNRYLEVIALFL